MDVVELPRLLPTASLQSVLDAATHVSIIILSTDGTVREFNVGAEQMLGYAADEIIGQLLLDVVVVEPIDTATESPTAIDALVINARQGGCDERQCRIRCKNGTRLIVNLAITGIKGSDGSVESYLAVATDITERVRSDEQLRNTMESLRESEERFREVAETVHEAFWLIDAKTNRILYVSPAYDSIWGESREGLYEDSLQWTRAIHPDDQTRVIQLFEKSLKTGEFDTDFCLVRPDGASRWIHSRGFPVRDPDGSVVRLVGVSKDITLRKKMEQALRTSNEELEAFCYSVSHDLRAPLRHVVGFSQAVMEDYGDKLDDDGKEMLQMIREATQKMGALIDDLLALSRVSRREMQIEDVNLRQMFDDIVEELRGNYPNRNLQFTVADSMVIPGDRRMLRLALFNLLDNAVKYSALKDPALIEFGSISSATGPVFFVRDNGTGFDEKYCGKLFVPFQRLHRDEEFTGTGIGLAIVKRVINRHGGRVWAEAVKGQGAIFSFTISRELRLSAVSSGKSGQRKT